MRVQLVLCGDLLLYLPLLAVVELLNPCLASPLFHLPFEGGIIMVLNMVVGSAFEVLGDLRPAVAVDLMVLKDLVVLFESPLHLLDIGVEMVVPSRQGESKLVKVNSNLVISLVSRFSIRQR